MSIDKSDKKDKRGVYQPEVDKNDEVEGYASCKSHKQQCLHDCIGGTPFITDLH